MTSPSPIAADALADDWRLTALVRPKPLSKGVDARLQMWAGRFKSSRRTLRKILERAHAIDASGQELSTLAEADLRGRLEAVREPFRRGGRHAEAATDEALALVQEAVRRTLGFRPYPVQIAGALALSNGFIAEMATGEGKTVTAGMAAVLKGWSGKPCHVITANDYLADRDAETLRSFFLLCGVTVGRVISESKPEERRVHYARDVTYTTAKEVLADFLRDRIALGRNQDRSLRLIRSVAGSTAEAPRTVQRGIHTAIVDEADNVLIDEAVTPLIIARREPNAPFMEACALASTIASGLEAGNDYLAFPERREIRFVRDPSTAIRLASTDSTSPFAGSRFLRDMVRQALSAREFFLKDRQYVVDDGKIVIVDESTGRQMPMRAWSAGLHQMVELKEGLEPTPIQETDARMSFQRFFRFYREFGGMTGTGKEAADEFWHVYGTPVLPVPPHRPNRRTLLPLRFFTSSAERWEAVAQDAAAMHRTGRPVLLGTRSVAASESISRRLADLGIRHEVVNAMRQDQEAAIIERAGWKGAVTVATNMAGRGTDIKLDPGIDALGGLHVIATECHGSARIDRQLFGRAARQGDPGSAAPYASLQDDLLEHNLPRALLRSVVPLVAASPSSASAVGTRLVRIAQRIARSRDASSRLAVQRMDTWLDDSLSFAGGDVR